MTRISRHRFKEILTIFAMVGIGPAQISAQDRVVVPRAEARMRQADADYHRGLEAAEGNGGRRDYAAAARYYRSAAENGHIPAQYNLAYLYENGLGVKQDFSEAAAWYRKAADQGDAESQNDLGVLYSTGQGVPLDDVEAVRLYRLAASQDDPEGISNLASMLLKGRGVPRDPDQALELFAKAASRGYSVAQNNLAIMYANGAAGKPDYVKAYAWLDLAAAEISNASELRDKLAKVMTPVQLTEARQLAEQRRKEIAGKDEKK